VVARGRASSLAGSTGPLLPDSARIPELRRRGVRRHPRGRPAGRRLYVAREGDEIRIIDIALLPDYCNRGIGTTLLRGLQSEAAAAGKPRLRSSRYGGQAAAHSCRAVQSRAAALRAARVAADRRSRGLSVHGVEGRQLPTSNSQLPRRAVRTIWVKAQEQAV
jgi:GNAT superfamily N-acetyltransferase